MPLAADGTAYDLTGPCEAPVVALIHGLGMTRQSTWGAIAPVLADRYRVLSYDLLGHGQSELPNGAVNLTSLSEQLIALLDELEFSKAALVGFSLGGMINRRCAIDHGSRVSALTILNSPHERSPEKQELVEAQARDASAGGPEATIDAALDRWFTERFRQEEKETVANIRATILANDPTNYAAHRLVLAEGVKELICPNPPLAQPTLVMTCEHDSGSTPEMSRAIAGELAEAEVKIVPMLRHLGLIERPELFFAPLLNFLGTVLG